MDSAVLKLSTEKILARKEDGIGWLTFNQPERRNAISVAIWDAIAIAAESFAADPDRSGHFHRTVGLRDEWASIQKAAAR